jgi:hypothetical protein
MVSGERKNGREEEERRKRERREGREGREKERERRRREKREKIILLGVLRFISCKWKLIFF